MPDLDFKVLFLSDHGMRPSLDPQFGISIRYDVPLLDGYPWELLEGRSRKPHGPSFDSVWATGLHNALRGYQAVVVSGWNYLGYVHAIQLARFRGARVIHLSESTLEDHHRPLSVRMAKALLFKGLIRPNDHALATGVRSRRYLEHAGVRPRNIHAYPYTTDTSLTDEAWPRRAELRAAVRADLGIPADAVVFLFSGKLIPKKNPVGVADAFTRLKGEPHLLMMGAGELEGAVRARLDGHPRAHLLGFRNQSEVASFYAAADVLVLPSVESETWGLVVNEAMAMGDAVIVSDRVGSSEDLVQGQGTGLTVPASDLHALAAAMQRAVDDRASLASWQRRARDRIVEHTPDRAAAGVREAVLA